MRYALAMAVVVIAFLLSHQTLEAPKGASRVVRTVPVVIAAHGVPEGSTFDRTSLVVAQWPMGTIPAGAFTSVDSVVGRVARVPVYQGEAIVPGRLAPAGKWAGLGVTITPGKRAFSFRVSDVAGIPTMVQPNSRVDIMLIMNSPRDDRTAAKLFLSNIRVLAVRPLPQRAEDGRPLGGYTATVEVTPEEGERLAIALSQGQLGLVLRGRGDYDPVITHGATSDSLMHARGRSTPSPAERPRDLRPLPSSPARPPRDSLFRDLLLRRSGVEERKFSSDSTATRGGRPR